ncbi:MAG: hypothetical protein ABEJ80_09050 [Halarchaeum sp.]
MHGEGRATACHVTADASGGPTLETATMAVERTTRADAPAVLDGYEGDVVLADRSVATDETLAGLLADPDGVPCVVVDETSDGDAVDRAVADAVARDWHGYPVAANERERLAAVEAYDFDDPTLRRHLDGLATTVRECFDARVGVVGVVGETTERFVAEDGMGRESLARRDALCARGIFADGTLVAPSLGTDPRVNADALDDGLEFYAGAPIRTPSGTPIGMLCVLDDARDGFDEADRDALAWLSEQASGYADRYGR